MQTELLIRRLTLYQKWACSPQFYSQLLAVIFDVALGDRVLDEQEKLLPDAHVFVRRMLADIDQLGQCTERAEMFRDWLGDRLVALFRGPVLTQLDLSQFEDSDAEFEVDDVVQLRHFLLTLMCERRCANGSKVCYGRSAAAHELGWSASFRVKRGIG